MEIAVFIGAIIIGLVALRLLFRLIAYMWDIGFIQRVFFSVCVSLAVGFILYSITGSSSFGGGAVVMISLIGIFMGGE